MSEARWPSSVRRPPSVPPVRGSAHWPDGGDVPGDVGPAVEVLDDVETFSAPRTCELAHVTYRQLDYWVRTGLVVPSVEARGSGTRRRFSRRDVQIVAALGHVEIAFGIRPLLAAALRTVDPLPPWVVIVGDWTARCCSTLDELRAAVAEQSSGVIRVVLVETLVDFDAVPRRELRGA